MTRFTSANRRPAQRDLWVPPVARRVNPGMLTPSTLQTMNTCCSSTLPSLNSPAPARPPSPFLLRLARLLGPVAVDMTHFLFVDEPRAESQPRTTIANYR